MSYLVTLLIVFVTEIPKYEREHFGGGNNKGKYGKLLEIANLQA